MTSVTIRENEQAAVETLASGKTYEPSGRLDGLTYGNVVIPALGYDLDGRITAVNTLAGASSVLSVDFDRYDLADNIRNITGTGAPGIWTCFQAGPRFPDSSDAFPVIALRFPVNF